MASHHSLRCDGMVFVPYRIARGGGPGAVAGDADDGALVNVASADEAEDCEVVSSSNARKWVVLLLLPLLPGVYICFETVSFLMPKASAKVGSGRGFGAGGGGAVPCHDILLCVCVLCCVVV